MPELLSQLHSLNFSLQQAQQLAKLKQLQGMYSAANHYSPDWLANLEVRADQQAATLLSHSTIDEMSFDYAQGLRFVKNLKLTELKVTDLLQLHQQLHPKGGQLRQLKLSQPLRHQADQVFAIPVDKASVKHLEQLIMALRKALAEDVDPLISIPVFIYELLLAFPFLNGNRRVALLLAKRLLSEQGHSVINYQALEAQIIGNDPQLYQHLYLCSHGKNSIQDWLSYWWQLISHCYQDFFAAAQHNPIKNYRGGKTQLIRNNIQQMQGAFSLAELQQQLPTVGTDLIRKVVRDCRNEGWLQSTGRGRSAKWVCLS